MHQVQGPDQADADFHELAGRLEGTVRALMLLAAKLEKAGVLRRNEYAAGLRREAERLSFEGNHLLAAQRTMREIARVVDTTPPGSGGRQEC